MKPLLLDANLLIVLIVGMSDPTKLGVIKCVKEYGLEHLQFINRFASSASSLVTVPSVLTQTSDLLGEGKNVVAAGVSHALRAFTHRSLEVYKPSREVMESPAFERLGLADSLILDCLAELNACLLTADFQLDGYAKKQNLESYNIWHQWTPSWVN